MTAGRDHVLGGQVRRDGGHANHAVGVLVREQGAVVIVAGREVLASVSDHVQWFVDTAGRTREGMKKRAPNCS